MATRRTFEGTDLEALLSQVRSQLGDDARIISAEKTRSGGVGGFFVKEQYVVVAEARRAERRPAAPSKPAAPRQKVPSALAIGAVPPRQAPGLPAAPSRPAANTMDRLLAMADAVSAKEIAATRATPALPAPAQAAPRRLAPAQAASASAAAVRAADAARRSSFDLLSSRTAAPAVSGAPRPAPPVESVFARAERMGPVIDLTDPSPRAGGGVRPRLPRLDGEEIVVAHTATGKRLGRLRPAFSDAPRLRRSELGRTTVGEDLEDDIEPPRWAAASPARRERQRSAGAAVASRDALIDLGVPSGLIEVADVTSDELAEMFAELAPETTPATVGQVTVFIGELDSARALAERLGAETVVAAPTTPDGVSAWLVLRDPESARARRSKWTSRSAPTVVAIDGSPLSSDPEWVMAMVDAVMPDHLHLVVDASWDMRLLGDWVRGLTSVVGEDCVVIDLVGADRAARPAAVLGLGLPVETLDGRDADGRTWADLLVSHLLANRMGA